ncbi:hypothetical protein P4V41_12735 [Fictibacillus nanhaiensis]|uniref:hypothetical protein n=1 Tax=Fictibacillus nanhaiensis TaxID=742169 RepID=UPI002E1F14A4|nr:hypothetical protein [Fictibacillus nanhaiensis]
MKIWISLIAGLVIGVVLSYFFLNYNGSSINEVGKNGEIIKTTNELDFNLITNSFLIIISVSILIYVFWTLVEKKGREV